MSHRLPSRLLTFSSVALRGLTHVTRRPPDPLRRVLIAHHLLLGDTLMLTPLLAKLHEHHPEVEVVMTAPKAVAPLYQHRPYGVTVMPYDPRDAHTLRTLMQRTGYDLALIPGDNRYAWTAYALGARWIRAFAGDTPGYKSWPVDELIAYPDTPAAWADMNAGLIEGPPPALYRAQDWAAPDYAPFEQPAGPYCVLHVGASSPLKHWPDENWLQLAEILQTRGLEVIWSGGPGEEQLIEALDPERRYRSLAGQLDLTQMWQLIKSANLLVCPDTGIAHIGRLVHTPTVTLFGPGSADLYGAGAFWAQAPYIAISDERIPCRDQHLLYKREIAWVRRCGRSPSDCPDHICMAAISGEQVITAVDALLKAHRQGNDAQEAAT